jgi:hypothetical protein
MQLDVRATFLALHDSPNGGERALSIHSDFESAIAGWTVGSRLSPIWRLQDDKQPPVSAPFDACQISFIGPVQPARLVREVHGIEEAVSIWASLGCFNMVVHTDITDAGQALAVRIAEWAKKSDIAFEQWTIKSGIIDHVDQHVLARRESDVLAKLAKYGDALKHPMTRTSYQENLVATATSLARAAAVYPPIYDEIESAAGSICIMMEKFASGQMDLLNIQSRLLTMNAAISRFSSQAFSGIPPIRGTECHFWIHSLLGTGSANLALASVVASVQLVLGEARLPERLRQLSYITTKIPDSSELTADPTLLDFDLLDAVEPEGNPEKIVPLVTYFSGRDGFSSHVQTLSAPLTTLAECNSLRSNLLTVTHEISHIFVQSALAELSPTPGKDEDFQWARKLLAPHAKPANMLEAARLLFLEAVVSMATESRADQKPFGVRELENQLPSIIEWTRLETQEILVHAFDFQYFHAGDPEYYVSNIWHSWCAIPGIGDRIPEYLMRTLCAVSSVLLRELPEKRFQAALQDTKAILKKIAPNIDLPSHYVDKVLDYIERMENEPALMDRVKKQYFVRMRLVRLVRIFLFSDKLSAKLFHDPHIGGGEGYRQKKPLIYDSHPVGNALTFLRGHLKQNPTEAESMWVLHALAFDSSPSPLAAS